MENLDEIIDKLNESDKLKIKEIILSKLSTDEKTIKIKELIKFSEHSKKDSSSPEFIMMVNEDIFYFASHDDILDFIFANELNIKTCEIFKKQKVSLEFQDNL